MDWELRGLGGFELGMQINYRLKAEIQEFQKLRKRRSKGHAPFRKKYIRSWRILRSVNCKQDTSSLDARCALCIEHIDLCLQHAISLFYYKAFYIMMGFWSSFMKTFHRNDSTKNIHYNYDVAAVQTIAGNDDHVMRAVTVSTNSLITTAGAVGGGSVGGPAGAIVGEAAASQVGMVTEWGIAKNHW